MTTRAKLYITSNTAGAMMMLTVFSKPLHIPDAFQWVLIVGVFIPLGLTFHYIKQQKLEKQTQPVSASAAAAPAISEERQRARRWLILSMVLGSAVGLCAPLWMPLTGTTLGARGDFICGLVAVAIVCSILGFRLKKL